MSDINGEGIGYGGGDPDGLDYDHLIDQADAGRFVVLLPSAEDDGQRAVECRTFPSSLTRTRAGLRVRMLSCAPGGCWP
jgi:hypothetical protein